MRDISPNFTSTSNIGGPFAPVVVGNYLKISYDSFLFTDGTELGSAKRLFLSPAAQITSNLKVYLKIDFNNGAFVDANVIEASDWWSAYPNTIKYNSDSKKIEDQTELYAPIFSIYNSSSRGVYGKYIYNSDDGELVIYRHITTNLMLMQACKFYFLLPAPFAPEIP